jgi:Holliday junction resolvase-like predicted endonuclease
MVVKHAQGRKPYNNSDVEWDKLCSLSRAYAAVTDIQPYTPTFFATLDAIDLMKNLQEMALYDTMFCIPQLRPTDAIKLARGMFDWFDTSNPTKAGWSVDQVLEIVGYILNPIHDVRGPIFFEEIDIRRKCPSLPSQVVTQILNEVLSHPEVGANQKFTRPTDVPIPEDPSLKDVGHDFFLRPLLRFPNRRYVLLDRSVCASACIESLLTPMRLEIKGLDGKIGLALERFLVTEFASHGVKIIGGDYDACDGHGECDLVVETPDNVIFIETKKKTLTRRAKAGYKAYLLLDLANSLLAAQVQAGWHEVRLRRDGHLDLKRDGIVTSLELKGREVERVAVSMFDYGSFQDRMLLKQFFEASINATFTPVGGDSSINKKFKEFNESLVEMREQVMIPNQGDTARKPFFNCWFLSVPQLLLLLDGVSDGSAFKTVLWSTRHIVTGNSDFYADLANMRKVKETVANKPSHLR